NPNLLPVEFAELDYQPSRWEPEDVVRMRSHGLVRNVRSEVARALMLRDYGEEAEGLRRLLQPEWETKIPDGLDLDLIPDDVLDVYQLATQGVTFQDSASTQGSESRLARLIREVYYNTDLGSNNWSISPQ